MPPSSAENSGKPLDGRSSAPKPAGEAHSAPSDLLAGAGGAAEPTTALGLRPRFSALRSCLPINPGHAVLEIIGRYQIPRYWSGDCQLISDASRRLRSSDTFTFAVPWTRTRLGDRSFAVAGPQIWNSLPADLRQLTTRFRRLLKGHMFGWGCGA